MTSKTVKIRKVAGNFYVEWREKGHPVSLMKNEHSDALFEAFRRTGRYGGTVRDLYDGSVRRLATRNEYILRKSRRNIINAMGEIHDQGLYRLLDPYNIVVLGPNFDATLEQIEAFLLKSAEKKAA